VSGTYTNISTLSTNVFVVTGGIITAVTHNP
jgi:hypothetical protein